MRNFVPPKLKLSDSRGGLGKFVCDVLATVNPYAEVS
jgi:hypothetical protein